MTPTQRAKELGCESLAHVARVTKQSEQTLINWFKNPKKKDLFDVCEDLELLQFNQGRNTNFE